jgi:hypothetical protein
MGRFRKRPASPGSREGLPGRLTTPSILDPRFLPRSAQIGVGEIKRRVEEAIAEELDFVCDPHNEAKRSVHEMAGIKTT